MIIYIIQFCFLTNSTESLFVLIWYIHRCQIKPKLVLNKRRFLEKDKNYYFFYNINEHKINKLRVSLADTEWRGSS